MMLMNSVNFDRKCRICAVDLIDITCAIPIFSGIALDAKIHRYLYITVTQNDELPKVICATCFIKIESIDKFAYLAAKTEETYYTWLKRTKDLVPMPHAPPSSGEIFDSADANKIILNTYRNPRNPRHVDHITLEQIINDQIVRNPKNFNVPSSTAITKFDSLTLSYHDLKIGQLIKDEELLKLMLKALKWMELGNRRYTGKYWLKKLKGSKFREVLSNPNLLNDSDLLQLLKSYMGQDALTLLNQIPFPSPNRGGGSMPSQDDDITQMEVGVDPSLFFDDDSRQTQSTPEVRNDGKFLCAMCSETFLSNSDLQAHVLTAHLFKKKPPTKKRSRRASKGNGVLQDSANLPSSSTNEQPKKRLRKPRKKKEPPEVKEDTENLPAKEPSEPLKVELIRIPPNMNPALLNLPPVVVKDNKNKEEPENQQEKVKQKRKQRIKVKEDSPTDSAVTIEEPKPAEETIEEPVKSIEIAKIDKVEKEKEPEKLETESEDKNAKQKKKKDEKIPCKKCRKKFLTRTLLRAHEKNQHKTSKFACDTCHKIFPSRSILMGHILSHALEKRSHKCPTCKKAFQKHKDMKLHMATHSDRPYPCNHCRRAFANSATQILHEKKVHGVVSKKHKDSAKK